MNNTRVPNGYYEFSELREPIEQTKRIDDLTRDEVLISPGGVAIDLLLSFLLSPQTPAEFDSSLEHRACELILANHHPRGDILVVGCGYYTILRTDHTGNLLSYEPPQQYPNDGKTGPLFDAWATQEKKLIVACSERFIRYNKP